MEPSSPQRMPDLELERLAAAGDADAFGELYERHSGRVYDYLLRVLRDPDEAADVMQDTFVRALNALEPGRAGAAQFSTWLFKIAHNLAVTRLERRARLVPLVPLDDDDAPQPDASVAIAHTPEAAAEARELQALVWEAAQALDPKQYALLDLHVRQGLDSGEIADVLGVSKGNAYTMLSRLRQTFESAVGGLVMSRRARGKCVELDAILDQHGDLPINAALRKRIEEHTARCDTCGEQRRTLVSASALLRAMPLVPLPLLIKERVGEAAAEAICANAAAATGGTGSITPGSGDSSWWQRTRDGGSGVKAAAIAGVAILAAVVLPSAAGLDGGVAPASQADVAAAAPAPESRPTESPSAQPTLAAVEPPGTPETLPVSAVLARSAAPAGRNAGEPPLAAGGAASPEPAGGVAAPTMAAPQGNPTAPPEPTPTPTRTRRPSSQDNDGGIPNPSVTPPPTSTARPPATATPAPEGTPKHCEHARGRGHDECDDDDDDDSDHDDDDHDDDDHDHRGRRRGHDD